MVCGCTVCMGKGGKSLADVLFSLAESLMQRHKNKVVYVSEATHGAGQS